MRLRTPDIHPLFNQTQVTIIGNPLIVTSPVGNGIRIADNSKIIYKFTVSQPWSCPFDVNQCPIGFTLSFWFRWEYVVSSYYRDYITLGKVFAVYGPPRRTDNLPPRRRDNLLQMIWNVNREFSGSYSRGMESHDVDCESYP